MLLVLPAAIALAVAAGFGGRPSGLAKFRLSALLWVLGGVLLQVLVITRGNGPLSHSGLNRTLLMLGSAVVIAGFWQLRRHPGAPVALLGLLLNAGVMLINGGSMVVPTETAVTSGLTVLQAGGDAWIPASKAVVRDWAAVRTPWLTDIIPIEIGSYHKLLSVGDLIFAVGLGVTAGCACWPASQSPKMEERVAPNGFA